MSELSEKIKQFYSRVLISHADTIFKGTVSRAAYAPNFTDEVAHMEISVDRADGVKRRFCFLLFVFFVACF